MKKMFALSLLVAAPLLAEAYFPEILRDDSEDQVGGVCHLHAAVALVEAVCFQSTGVKLNLSESYLAYRHLRPRIQSMKTYPLSQQGEEYGHISTLDAGYATDSLPRILAGQAILEDEFPKGLEFLSQAYYFVRNEQEKFEKASEKAAKFAVAITPFGRNTKAVTERRQRRQAKNFDKDFPENFAKLLDGMVQARRPDARAVGLGGLVITSRNTVYRQCVSRLWKIEEKPYSDDLARQLLDRQIPFICTGTWLFSQKWHPHAGVVVGYRESDAGLELYARHHESKRPFDWNLPKCAQITYLQ